MKILLTAFDPFDGETTNPALEAVKAVDTGKLAAEVRKIEVPTVFGKSIDRVAKEIRAWQPDLVLAVGQAGGRSGLTLERVAINQDDARIPDNEGQAPIDRTIRSDGPAAYFSTLPIKAMVEEIRKGKLPASVSNSAGTFVCNHLMYGILYTLDKECPRARGGFLHVPFIPDQVVDRPTMPSMALRDMARGIELALSAALEHEEDIAVRGGTLH